MERPLPYDWFQEDAVTLAPKLLGKIVRRGRCAARIVEVEAYTTDAASHAAKDTPRARVMRETYGHWYVYFTYGMHWCANVTAGDGTGGILIRAAEPLEGIALMQRRRGTKDIKKLCSGPGRFGQAFGVSAKDYGKPVAGDFAIYDAPELPLERIGSSPRIGVSKAAELPWRFFELDSPYLSR